MLMWGGGTYFTWDGVVPLGSAQCHLRPPSRRRSCSVPPALTEASLELLLVMPSVSEDVSSAAVRTQFSLS